MKSKIGRLLSLAGALVGFFFVGVISVYYYLYLSQTDDPSREDYLIGVTIASLYAFPAWLAASLGVTLIRNDIPRLLSYATYAMTGAVVLIFYLGKL